MKVSLWLIYNTPMVGLMQIDNDAFECDTDWFLETNPSINDTHLFLPDWEDKNDLVCVTMFFVAEMYEELLQKNDDILCPEAKMFLSKYKEMRDSNILNDEEREKLIRKFVEGNQ